MDEWRKNLPPVQGPFTRDGDVQSKNSDGQLAPPFEMPTGPPEHWDSEAMINRVKVGMMVELSTIPLYLYAMYSVKPTNEDGLRARATLRGVLQQEMLHLALVGNLLTALGGSLDLYNPFVVPTYPGHILMDEIPLTLRTLDIESLDYFIQIEGPSLGLLPPDTSKNVVPEYRSIGDLYEDVIKGVRGLPDEDFANNPDNQFTGNDFFGGQLSNIADRDTALQALRMIIEQGEGNTRVEDSHFDVFTRLRNDPGRLEVHPVPSDPQTADYRTNTYIYNLSIAFDAAYCYLLQTIQRIWRNNEILVRRILNRNIHAIMSNVLTPLAEILVQQPWQGGVAAPCFNYYPTVDVGPAPILTPEALHTQLRARMRDAADASSDAQQKLTLERIHRYIDENVKPSS